MVIAPFACALDLQWRDLRFETIIRQFERISAVCPSTRAVTTGPLVCAVADPNASSHIAHVDGAVAIGNVRLDDVTALPVPLHNTKSKTALELALESWVVAGDAALKTFVGDFAIVMLDLRGKKLVACRDAFGVRLLVTKTVGHLLFVASHAWILGEDDFSPEYLSDFILGSQNRNTHTVFRGVSRLAPGSAIKVSDGKTETVVLWSAGNSFPPDTAPSPPRFLTLFREAIQTRTQGEDTFWVQLSGGLDSSSVVCVAHAMNKAGAIGSLGGTVTVVDDLGEGDETYYSEHIVSKLALRNHKLVNFWPWRDDGEGPPKFCDPDPFFAFFQRRRAMCNAVAHGGARVLLTGLGSDHYLSLGYDFISDMVWRGEIRRALAFLTERAISSKRSFWRLVWTHALLPLLPFRAQTRLIADHLRIPKWVRADFVRKHDMRERIIVPRPSRAPRGQLLKHHVAST